MNTRPSFQDFANKKASICLVGLGYVGLPLAAVLARKFKVVGFDINEQRVKELREGHDRTRELTAEQLEAVTIAGAMQGNGRKEAQEAQNIKGGEQRTKGGSGWVRPNDARAQSAGSGREKAGLEFSTDPRVIGEARLIIVTVPTPIDDHKNPDLTPLVKASTMIGKHIKAGTTVWQL